MYCSLTLPNLAIKGDGEEQTEARITATRRRHGAEDPVQGDEHQDQSRDLEDHLHDSWDRYRCIPRV